MSKTKKKKTSPSIKISATHTLARPQEDQFDEARAEDVYARIRALATELESVLVFLPPKRRRGMLRLPRRSEPVVRLVLGIARERGLLAGKPGESRSERAVAQAKSFQIAETGIRSLAQVMRDSLRVWEARAWGETTALYSALWAMARYDATLQGRLRPAREFFKERRRGKKKRIPKAKTAAKT